MTEDSNNTARSNRRKIDFSKTFEKNQMLKVWKGPIRDGLRNQGVNDLYDYFDFHQKKEVLLTNLASEVASFKYVPSKSYTVRLEKSYGISRRIQIPEPEDAILLQTLVEVMGDKLLKASPSDNVFYSRTHGNAKKATDIDSSYPYVWWEIFPIFQEKIWSFSEACPYIVITDIANYFDSIPMAHLRNIISSLGEFEESLLDFLFFMLEEFIWRPDYLPPSGVGLPQINFDSPRLLAHVYLFELDNFIKDKVGENFTRWMDDIVIGVKSYDEGRKLLKEIDDLLHTRGIRLNSGKTKILNSEEAAHYYAVEENRYLSDLSEKIKNLSETEIFHQITLNQYKTELENKFLEFIDQEKMGVWEKIIKRYIALFSKFKSEVIDDFIPLWLHTYPSLRETIFRYFSTLGFSENRFGVLSNYIEEKCLDDDSFFHGCLVLINWDIVEEHREKVISFAKRLVARSTEVSFISAIWIFSKYGKPAEIKYVIKETTDLWKRNSFIARQVAAASIRLHDDPRYVEEIRKILLESGQLKAVQVMEHISEIHDYEEIPQAYRDYLLPKNNISKHSLSKILIAICVLNNTKIKKDSLTKLQIDLLNILDDSTYIKLIKEANFQFSTVL